MEQHRNSGCDRDHGPGPFVGDVPCAARQNRNFRTAHWTGRHLQMTLMSIPVGDEIGVEMHDDTDQIIRVEEGRATVRMGKCRERLDAGRSLGTGDTLFVPCGTWHNVLNSGTCPLKLSSVYGPPNHPAGTVHRTGQEARH